MQDPTDRETACEVLFEALECHSISALYATTAALAHTGRTAGIVCDIGDASLQVEALGGDTHHPLDSDHGLRARFGGKDITAQLHRYLRFDLGLGLEPNTLTALARDLKARHCAVALASEPQSARKKPQEERISLPDGSVLTLPSELFSTAAESMLAPLPGADSRATHTLPGLIAAVGNDCGLGAASKVVVLTGGGSLLTNLDARLTQELPSRLVDFRAYWRATRGSLGSGRGAHC